MPEVAGASFMGWIAGPAPFMLEPYEKSLIRGTYRLARKGSRKSRESAKEQALKMFVGWVRKEVSSVGQGGGGVSG